MGKEVVLTGLRSNSELHLGNYLGAILPMVGLQKKHAGKYQLNTFVPDLHSFTTPIDHGNLYEQSLKNIKTFVAAGLDINQPDTYIYRQSYIPAHSELTWILDCFAYFGELSRMTEFKEKSGLEEMADRVRSLIASQREVINDDFENKYETSESVERSIVKETHRKQALILDDLEENLINEFKSRRERNVSVGLFNYPVLMAADMLLYGAKWVPVGEDQRQHVEFTRDLAIRMNNKFGDLFIPPEDNAKQTEFSGRSGPVRIRSLRNPDKKMSKSVEDPAGTIMLSDNPDEAAKKVMGATTDSLESINFDWEKQPGIANLLQILALISKKPQDETNSEWQGKPVYGELKSAVAEAVKAFLVEFQATLAKVDQQQLIAKLEADEAAMREVANATLAKVQVAVGLRPKA